MSTSPISLLPPPDGSVDTAYSDLPKREVKTEMRILTPEECQQLAPVFERAGAVLPDPSCSFIVGILEDGKPTESFLTIQACIHGEPLNILPKHRMYLKSMVHYAENQVIQRVGSANVFMFVPEGQTKELAKAFGWKEEEWRILSKTVGPTGEPS